MSFRSQVASSDSLEKLLEEFDASEFAAETTAAADNDATAEAATPAAAPGPVGDKMPAKELVEKTCAPLPSASAEPSESKASSASAVRNKSTDRPGHAYTVPWTVSQLVHFLRAATTPSVPGSGTEQRRLAAAGERAEEQMGAQGAVRGSTPALGWLEGVGSAVTDDELRALADAMISAVSMHRVKNPFSRQWKDCVPASTRLPVAFELLIRFLGRVPKRRALHELSVHRERQSDTAALALADDTALVPGHAGPQPFPPGALLHYLTAWVAQLPARRPVQLRLSVGDARVTSEMTTLPSERERLASALAAAVCAADAGEGGSDLVGYTKSLILAAAAGYVDRRAEWHTLANGPRGGGEEQGGRSWVERGKGGSSTPSVKPDTAEVSDSNEVAAMKASTWATLPLPTAPGDVPISAISAAFASVAASSPSLASEASVTTSRKPRKATRRNRDRETSQAPAIVNRLFPSTSTSTSTAAFTNPFAAVGAAAAAATTPAATPAATPNPFGALATTSTAAAAATASATPANPVAAPAASATVEAAGEEGRNRSSQSGESAAATNAPVGAQVYKRGLSLLELLRHDLQKLEACAAQPPQLASQSKQGTEGRLQAEGTPLPIEFCYALQTCQEATASVPEATDTSAGQTDSGALTHLYSASAGDAESFAITEAAGCSALWKQELLFASLRSVLVLSAHSLAAEMILSLDDDPISGALSRRSRLVKAQEGPSLLLNDFPSLRVSALFRTAHPSAARGHRAADADPPTEHRGVCATAAAAPPLFGRSVSLPEAHVASHRR